MHYTHYTKSDAKAVIGEWFREYETYANDVDNGRAKDNGYINFKSGVTNSRHAITDVLHRVDEIKGGARTPKNTKVMVEVVITYPFTECDNVNGINVPKDPELEKAFFNSAYKFLCARYGKDNMVCCALHRDETTPHMHIGFVPEATSRKTGKRTVSTASLITRDELRNVHRDLQDHMINEFGSKADGWILNGRTQGYDSVKDLKKAKKVKEELQEVEDEVKEAKQDLYNNQLAISDLLQRAYALMDYINDVQAHFETHPVMDVNKFLQSPEGSNAWKQFLKRTQGIDTEKIQHFTRAVENNFNKG